MVCRLSGPFIRSVHRMRITQSAHMHVFRNFYLLPHYTY